jgi:hypothetical protein
MGAGFSRGCLGVRIWDPLSRFGCHVSGHTEDWPQRAQRALRKKKQFSDFLCALCALNFAPSVLNLSGVSWEGEQYRSRE